MLKLDVVMHFQTQREVARALGITEQAVSSWGEVIPEKNALRLQQITRGKLAYNECMYRHERKHAS